MVLLFAFCQFQSCLPIVVDGVRVGTGMQKEANECDVAGARRDHESSASAGVSGVDIGVFTRQQSDDADIPLLDGNEQCRILVAVGDLGIGPGVEEKLYHPSMSPFDCQQESRKTIAISHVDIKTIFSVLVEQTPQSCVVASAGKREELLFRHDPVPPCQ